jgi:hypothetical protein
MLTFLSIPDPTIVTVEPMERTLSTDDLPFRQAVAAV